MDSFYLRWIPRWMLVWVSKMWSTLWSGQCHVDSLAAGRVMPSLTHTVLTSLKLSRRCLWCNNIGGSCYVEFDVVRFTRGWHRSPKLNYLRVWQINGQCRAGKADDLCERKLKHCFWLTRSRLSWCYKLQLLFFPCWLSHLCWLFLTLQHSSGLTVRYKDVWVKNLVFTTCVRM